MELAGNPDELEKEIGDVFFALTNYARFLGINPENALRRTNEKFIARFTYIEKRSRNQAGAISDSNWKKWIDSGKRANQTLDTFPIADIVFFICVNYIFNRL